MQEWSKRGRASARRRAQDIDPVKNIGIFSALLETPAGQPSSDEISRFWYDPSGRSFDYRPVFGQIFTALTGLNSVLVIMPDPNRATNPWAQDLAALRGDMRTIGRDAWTVIARHENERRRQEG